MDKGTIIRGNIVSLLCLAGGALALGAGPKASHASEYRWIAAGGGAFHNPMSWIPFGPPGSSSTAIFDQPLEYQVSIEHPLTTNERLRVSAGEVDFRMGVPGSDDYGPATYNLLGSGTYIRTAAIIGTSPAIPATLRIRDHDWHGIPTAQINAQGMLILGQVTDSIGTLIIGDSTSQQTIWNSSYPTLIGSSGMGELKIGERDRLINSSATLGLGPGSEGIATVFYSGSWTSNGTLTIGNSGTGTLNVHDEVINTGDAYIAKEPGSVGTVNVDPASGFMYVADGWTCGGSMYVGGDDEGSGGTGELLVIEGGDVTIGEDLTVWSTGSITVDEGFIEAGEVDIRSGGSISLTGPDWAMGGDLNCVRTDVWYDGTLTINAGGDVNCDDFYAVGTVEIDGGKLSASNQVGSSPTCTFTLSDGTIQAGSLTGFHGDLVWTQGAVDVTASSFSIDVDQPLGHNVQIGEGKSLSVANNLNVGLFSNGILGVVDGGTVTSGTATIGSLSEDMLQASALLNGTDTTWTITGDLDVRGAVVSHLSVTSGATVSNDNAYLAAEPGTNALVTLFGTDAQWDCAGGLYAGGNAQESRGAATVQVDGSAQLSVAGTLKVWDDSVVEIDGGSVVTSDLDIAGEVVLLNSGVLDVCGGMLDIDNGGILNGAVTGDSLTEVALYDSYTSWLTPGSLVIAASDTGAGHIGALTFGSGTNVTVEGTVTVSAGDRLAPAGGTLNAEVIDMLDQDLSGHGTLNGEFLTSGSVTATGTLTVGDIDSYTAVQIGGELNVGQHHVTLNKQGTLSVGGPTTIAGGTLVVPNGIALPTGNSISGNGSVHARIAAQIGSTIQADGDLSIGDSASPVGFLTDGDLVLNANTVTIEDSNEADLGAITWLGSAAAPGTLAASNGLVLEGSDNVQGFGVINTPDDPTMALLNDGAILGNSASERIEVTGYLKGLGMLDNVTITGTDAPGNVGPAAVDRGSVDYAGRLVVEIRGLYAGTEHDQINHSATAGLGGDLTVELVDGFEPVLGDSFTILTYGSHTGQFDTLSLPALPAGLLWHIDYGTSSLTMSVQEQSSGDCDLDGDVDLADYTHLEGCLTGPGVGLDSGCECFDVDSSGTVDLADFALFQAAFTAQ